MKIDIRFFAAPGLLLLAGLGTPAAAQRPRNDGFCRRDGQMHVLRNGQLRPLLRDARLPTGTIVTPDGFLIAKNGERTALSEGQGCDLQGHIMTVEPALGGSLALGKTAAPPVSVPASAAEEEAAGQNARFGQQQNAAAAAARDQSNQPDQPANTEDEKKREEQAREQRKRDEERQREEVKRGEENEREARKEEKEMRKKDRKGDD